MNYDLNFNFIWANFDKILWGLVKSLSLAAMAIPIAMVLGLLLALIYTDGSRPFRAAVIGFVETVRNAPLLLWVYLVYYGLPQAIGLRFDTEVAFVGTLSLYGTAYLVEIFRAGLEGVPRGQIDAGLSIGLTRVQLLRYVRLPTMFRIVLPSLSNASISIFKDTSIAMVLGIPELTFTAQWINTSTFRVVEAWMVILPLYLVTTYVIILMLRWFEGRFRIA